MVGSGGKAGSGTGGKAFRRQALELPTWGLIAAVYGGWLALVVWHAAMPLWLWLPAAAWIAAWHGSLQHELIHGHPTRSRRLNAALGWPPLALWLPYELYRDLHLRHHRDAWLTDPLEDPESFYLPPDLWARRSGLIRAAAWTLQTFAGRILLGPLVSTLGFWAASLIERGAPGKGLVWARHLAGVALLLAFAVGLCGVPLWAYLAGFVYGGRALSLIRSFAEHRAADTVAHRTAIVEASAPWALLFLNNNLHVVHHDHPGVAWYRLPALYRAERARILAANGGLIYQGYGEIVRRFLVRPVDRPVHPGRPAPAAANGRASKVGEASSYA